MTVHHAAAQKALDETRQAIASMRAMLDDERYFDMRRYLQGTIAEWEVAAALLEERAQEEAEGIYRMPFMSDKRLRIFDGADGWTHITMVDRPETDMVLKGMSADEFRAAALVVHGVREYFREKV